MLDYLYTKSSKIEYEFESLREHRYEQIQKSLKLFRYHQTARKMVMKLRADENFCIRSRIFRFQIETKQNRNNNQIESRANFKSKRCSKWSPLIFIHFLHKLCASQILKSFLDVHYQQT